MASLILDIQSKAMSGTGSVSDLLRLAKVAATKLDLTNELAWIERELSGYNGPVAELPSYRRLSGQLKAFNPYRGWIPVQFSASDVEHEAALSRVEVGTSIPELEAMLGRDSEKGDTFFYNTPAYIQNLLRAGSSGPDFEIKTQISRSRLGSVVEAVRQLILDWSLKMEKAGVMGESLIFSPNEKEIAAPAAMQFHINNLGVLGNVSDKATVLTIQSVQAPIDLSALKAALQEIRETLPLAKERLQPALAPVLDAIDAEAGKPSPDHRSIRTLLQSAKSIAENAAGGVIGSGIVAMLQALLH